MLVFEEIKKEKSKVFIKTNEGEYYFDFFNCATNFTGIIGGFRLSRETYKYSNFIYLLNKYVQKRWGSLSLINIETFWNCLNDVDIYDVPEKNPKGFVEFCFNNKFLLSQNNLEIYQIVKKNNLINDRDKLFQLKWIYNNTIIYFPTLEALTRKQILTILKLHSKTREPLFSELMSFLNFNPDGVFELIDSGKDIKKIIQFLKDKENEEINRGIKATQTFYSPAIDGIIHGDLIVVVPQSIEDLIDEGTQQHNCVGEYYNERIAEGEDFIFFIRKKSNPKESYITCRYNISDEELAEINTRFNGEEYTSEEYEFALKMADLLKVF
jgi:hypothetical protein